MRQAYKYAMDMTNKISIHAPMKGATFISHALQYANVISIHAPMKGATSSITNDYKYPHISIHAPMKGATVFKLTQSSPAFLSSILRTETKPI